MALTQFASPQATRYQLKTTVGVINKTAASLTVGIDQNLWSSLTYTWIASALTTAVQVGQFISVGIHFI
jgi:hypothetical protein